MPKVEMPQFHMPKVEMPRLHMPKFQHAKIPIAQILFSPGEQLIVGSNPIKT